MGPPQGCPWAEPAVPPEGMSVGNHNDVLRAHVSRFQFGPLDLVVVGLILQDAR